jgi:hypothetical protein
MTQRQTSLVVAGLCCILCPSLGMLAATYYNRSGAPASILQLTERELRLPEDAADAAQSALTFGLLWRVEGMGHADFVTQPSMAPVRWMTAAKSAELGVKSVDDLRWRASVPAFLVLEFNGPSYAREIEQACRNGGSAVCDRVRNLESRLYVIDAGTDPQVLRKEYPDTGVYAIVHGIVTFAGARDDAEPAATIGAMDVETVQATEPLRSHKTKPSGEMSWYVLSKDKSFVAEIAFGRRHEPWNRTVSFGPHPGPLPAQINPN